jgi:hypothetical protein
MTESQNAGTEYAEYVLDLAHDTYDLREAVREATETVASLDRAEFIAAAIAVFTADITEAFEYLGSPEA